MFGVFFPGVVFVISKAVIFQHSFDSQSKSTLDGAKSFSTLV